MSVLSYELNSLVSDQLFRCCVPDNGYSYSEIETFPSICRVISRTIYTELMKA